MRTACLSVIALTILLLAAPTAAETGRCKRLMEDNARIEKKLTALMRKMQKDCINPKKPEASDPKCFEKIQKEIVKVSQEAERIQREIDKACGN